MSYLFCRGGENLHFFKIFILSLFIRVRESNLQCIFVKQRPDSRFEKPRFLYMYKQNEEVTNQFLYLMMTFLIKLVKQTL